jgi:nucleotide-binding universal stress UspA family protein
MYSRILMAYDGTPTSQHALERAVELTKQLSANLRIVHVIDIGWLPVSPEVAIDLETLGKARRAGGEKLLTQAREIAIGLGLAPETRLAETPNPAHHAAESIAEEASRWPADLVVLGTHGRRGLQRLLLGSVAEQMSRLSPVPVLLVPSPKPEGKSESPNGS